MGEAEGQQSPGERVSFNYIERHLIPLPRPEMERPWEEVIEEGITNVVENFELLNSPAEEEGIETPISLSPFNLTEAEDPREFRELPPGDSEFIKQTLFQNLGFTEPEGEDETGIAVQYEFNAPKPLAGSEQQEPSWRGKAKVTVFRTERSESDGIFLHRIRYSDGREEYVLASEKFRFPDEPDEQIIIDI